MNPNFIEAISKVQTETLLAVVSRTYKQLITEKNARAKRETRKNLDLFIGELIKRNVEVAL